MRLKAAVLCTVSNAFCHLGLVTRFYSSLLSSLRSMPYWCHSLGQEYIDLKLNKVILEKICVVIEFSFSTLPMFMWLSGSRTSFENQVNGIKDSARLRCFLNKNS